MLNAHLLLFFKFNSIFLNYRNTHKAHSPLNVVGVYGDVQRVKILFKKKDNALIQFTDPNMARTG